MVYPQEHVLLRFNGHFGLSGTISDRWSVGMRFGKPTSAPAYDPAKLQVFVNAAQTAANTFHAAVGSGTGTNTFMDQVAGAQIGVLGNYVPTNQLTVLSSNTPTAGNGSGVNPWNTAHVISLRTAVPRGRGSNGRVYWPAIALTTTNTTGRVSQSTSQTRLNLFKTFLDALNSAANTYDPGTRLLVASNVQGGVHAIVTGIRSDDRLDSIERRENDQPPVYATASLA